MPNKSYKILNLSWKLQFLIAFTALSALSLVFLGYPQNIFVVLVLIITGTVFYVFLARARKNEIEQILEVIRGIRKNVYNDPAEITLGQNLAALESEIRKMLEKMKGDIEYLKKLERMRTEFIGNVSHELKTPIFTIQGFLEALMDGALHDNEVNMSFLQKANQHTANLSTLVNDLIDISMIETGEMRMSFRYFGVNDFVTSVINEMKLLAEEKGLYLLYTPVRENLQVFGDKARLRQVFINLLTNAIKYTDKGEVSVTVEEEARGVLIKIRDTGIGIPEQARERIFERFYRVDKARSKSAGGTGLGLAIVKHIIEAHGSKIDVKSIINEGSEFFFRLKK